MITAGVDIGSTTTKAVILDERRTLAAVLKPSGELPGETAKEVYARAVSEAGLRISDIEVVATTGYGRRLVAFADNVLTEIKACATGVLDRVSSGEPVRTIIDVGGQDTKVITLTDGGDLDDFSMNDKCAAGTGRFLEMLADKLKMSIEEFTAGALASDTTIQMSSTCAVFAESEAVGLLARGVPREEIAAAAHDAIARRIAAMTRRVGAGPPFSLVGGGALNSALARALEKHLAHPMLVPENPQFVIAIGAAVAARSARSKSA